MKKLLLILSLNLMVFISQAQFTVEAVYDSSYANLYIVKLEVDGEKFIRIDRDSANRQVRLYNLNHTLWKTFDLNSMPVPWMVFSDTTWQYNYDVL